MSQADPSRYGPAARVKTFRPLVRGLDPDAVTTVVRKFFSALALPAADEAKGPTRPAPLRMTEALVLGLGARLRAALADTVGGVSKQFFFERYLKSQPAGLDLGAYKQVLRAFRACAYVAAPERTAREIFRFLCLRQPEAFLLHRFFGVLRRPGAAGMWYPKPLLAKLADAFSAETVGLNQQEQTLRLTSEHCVVTLEWDHPGDLDLEVKFSVAGTEHVVWFGNAKTDGVCLDVDNRAGGKNSREVISFSDETLATFDAATVHVRVDAYQMSSYAHPCALTVRRHGVLVWEQRFASLPSGASESVAVVLPTNPQVAARTEPLPAGLELQRAEEKTPGARVELAAARTLPGGHGRTVFVGLRADPALVPHLRGRSMALLALGVHYQLAAPLTYDCVFEAGDGCVAPGPAVRLSEVPALLALGKKHFAKTPEGARAAESFRGRCFSALPPGVLEAVLGATDLPDVLAALIHAQLEEDPLLATYVQVPDPRATAEPVEYPEGVWTGVL